MENINAWEKAGKFFIGMLLFAIGATIRGFVIMSFWNWFISPLGVTNITFWLAVGIGLTFAVCVGNRTKQEDESKMLFYRMCNIIFAHLGILGMGAIVHLFV